MKRFKKILAVAIAMAMVVAMALPSFAASIEVKDDAASTHVYKVYQIFTGTLTEKTDATTGEKTQTLSDVHYGSNYKGPDNDKTTTDLVPKTELDSIGSLSDDAARAFAKTLKDGNNSNGEISGNAVATLDKNNGFKATGLADGYYLVVDETTDTALEDGDMLSRYIVQVIGDTELAPKKSTVEEHKNIKSDTHSPSDVTDDKKADDLSIGETVTYTIDATVPENAVDFDKFFFVINDTLSTGLTLNTTSFKVYHTSDSAANRLTEKTDYTLFVTDPEGTAVADQHDAPDTGKTFQIALKAPKDFAGKTIYVEYTATLNENAAIGETANTNKTTVQYSNKPEQSYDGKDNNNDGKPDDLTEDIYGETPEQETKTFTSSIRIKKVDETGEVLTGAKFKITGTSVKTVLVTSDEYTKDNTNGTYYLLKDGTYTTVAPSETDTYVAKDKTAADYDANDGGYVKDGDNYVVATYDQLKDSTTTIYAKVTATKDQYQSPITDKYVKATKTEAVETSSSVDAEAFVDANGFVKFDGLGAGTYTITETQTPAGYNSIDDFTVTITFDKTDADQVTTNNDSVDTDSYVWSATSQYVVDATENPNGTIAEIDSNSDSVVDTFQIQVKNQKGTVLPSTGGIGTTIFYVVGAILVIGAGVIMITRRRMDA